MDTLIENLKAERQQLQSELAADPRQQKIKKIDELLALYVRDENVDVSSIAQAAARELISTVEPNTPSKAEQIKQTVFHLLQSKGSVHRREILRVLQDANLIGYGGDQMGGLAAYLSKWRSDFSPDGRGNFSLVQKSTGYSDSVKN